MPALSILDKWKETWNSPFKKRRMIIGTIILVIVVFVLPIFFGYIEKRNGVLLNDWLLSRIPARNVSGLIFAIIWGLVVFIFIRALFNPSIYITYSWTLIFVVIARFICITLVPLDPPTGFIPLTDPLTSVFYGHVVVTKDLFFSGHTAILTLIVLCFEKKTDKLIAFTGLITVAFLLMVQHIHYTIDIMAAPVIVYAIYRLTQYFLNKGNARQQSQPQNEVLAEVYSVSK
ncbi:MAG: phosphatase PAP2-related protein [Sphingobacteriales bacterium]